MQYFIDYHPYTDFTTNHPCNKEFSLHSIAGIEDLAFMIHYAFDVNIDAVIDSVVRLLLSDENVIFVGNPPVFDAIRIPGTSKPLGEALLTINFSATQSMDSLLREITDEADAGAYVLVVRSVFIENDSVSFTYSYASRLTMNLNGAIRRCLIDEILVDL